MHTGGVGDVERAAVAVPRAVARPRTVARQRRLDATLVQARVRHVAQLQRRVLTRTLLQHDKLVSIHHHCMHLVSYGEIYTKNLFSP
jgi:hypothetical protein